MVINNYYEKIKELATNLKSKKEMKKILLLLLFIPMGIFSQYSNYYKLDINSKSQVNVNKNVNVSGNINKTVRTIDYGALRLANVQKEKNRLENLKYSNEIERERAIEIAANPIKAFDYGTDNSWKIDNKDYYKGYGIPKNSIWYHKIPHKSLFVNTGDYNYRNESLDGVITELEIGTIRNSLGSISFKNTSKLEKQKFLNKFKKYFGNTEDYVKRDVSERTVGEIFNEKYYTHKIEINKTKIYGQDGFVYSWFYEDDYEIVIKDNYFYVSPNGVLLSSGVGYKGDKDKVDFELLEGRRDYLKRLCDQIIATLRIDVGKRSWPDYSK